MSLTSWQPICSLEELRDGARLAKSFKNVSVLIFKLGDNIFAYEDRCPHAGAPLIDGKLCKDRITCRHHHWEFDLRTGASIKPQGKRLKAFPIKIEDDLVLINL